MIENKHIVNNVNHLDEDLESKDNPVLEAASCANGVDVKGLLDVAVDVVGDIVSNISF